MSLERFIQCAYFYLKTSSTALLSSEQAGKLYLKKAEKKTLKKFSLGVNYVDPTSQLKFRIPIALSCNLYTKWECLQGSFQVIFHGGTIFW